MPTRKGVYAERVVRSQLRYGLSHLPVDGIGPNDVQHRISQMAVDRYTSATMRATGVLAAVLAGCK